MRRLMIVLGVCVVTAASLLALDKWETVAWIGGFPLEVDLIVKGDKPVIRVSAQVVRFKDGAEALRADPRRFEKHPVGFELDLQPVAWQPRQPFVIEVQNYGKTSGLGRELSYSQHQLLVLLVEYADGTKEYMTAETPDGRRHRKITVEAP